MKRLVDGIWFYLSLGVLNLAVGVTFYAVTIRPPVALAISPGSSASREMVVQAKAVPAIQGVPERIVIPSLAIDLPVGVGSYDPSDGSWTLDETRAYYADVSLPANDSNGRTMIYGHAQAPVFLALADLPDRAKAEIYTDNGYVFHYEYTSVEEVVPTDTSVFKADGPPTLILQTCTGPWDAYRALHSFKFMSVHKI